MDNNIAAVLLTSLMERVDREQSIGIMSSLERQALQLAIQALVGGSNQSLNPVPTEPALIEIPPVPSEIAVTPTSQSTTIEQKPVTENPTISMPLEQKYLKVRQIDMHRRLPPTTSKPPELPKVKLVDESITRKQQPSDPEVLMCLDFGTAMSKAFASVSPDDYIDLELGAAAGRNGYTLPSSVFIGDDGKAYFGFEAIDLSQDLVDSGRERLDSIKGWLNLRLEGNLDGESCLLLPALNPTAYKLTQGDLIRIYMSYLTDMAGISLGKNKGAIMKAGRYVKRRFARPCWPNAAQTTWADKLMRSMLAEAQILADTFSGRWTGGIDVAELKAAVEEIKILGKRPDYLIDVGVPEPVAVAAGAIADSENLRDAFMVVDVGAGTTDFGLFVSTRMPNIEDDAPRVFQIPASIQGLMQAGDKVDSMLRMFIARKESVDTNDSSGRMVMADLGRRIRGLKEVLFKTKSLVYALADGTVGSVVLDDFLADATVKRFGSAIDEGFKKALGAVDDTYLRWLAMEGVYLHVVLTGGSSELPMMQALGEGVIEVRGFKIMRKPVNPKPKWMDPSLSVVYPQLAVAIGGTADPLPETLTAPPVFLGGGGHTRYVSGRLQLSGN